MIGIRSPRYVMLGAVGAVALTVGGLVAFRAPGPNASPVESKSNPDSPPSEQADEAFPGSFPLDTLDGAVADQIARAIERVRAHPTGAEELGHLGMLYHTYELYRLAEPCYRRAIVASPDTVRWRYYLALILRADGDPAGAAAELDRVLANRPNDVPALLERAGADLDRNLFDEAIAGYVRVMEVDPTCAPSHYGAGKATFKRGELTQAEVHLKRSLQLSPRYGKARYQLAVVLRGLGREAEAAEQFRLAEEQQADEPLPADPLAQELANLITGAIEPLHRGVDMLKAGRVDRAIALFEESLRFNPNLAETHANMGTALLLRGDLEGAANHLRKALELQPTYVQARYNLGMVAHRRGAASEAVEHFEAVLATQEDHFESHLGLGSELRELARPLEAVAHLRQAIALRPTDPRAYKRLAKTLFGLGDFEAGVRVLREAVRRVAEDASLADRLAWMLATCPEEHLRSGVESLDLSESVCLKTNRTVPRALDTLAAALANVGRFTAAVATAEEALTLARRQDRRDLANEIEGRLVLYRARRAYRQPRP